MSNKNSVLIKIKRQSTPTTTSYWEEFELAHKPNMNVISCLMEIAANPVTREGKPTTPITYDSNCLEEDLRLLRHAHQRTRPHGLLRAHRQSRATHQARTIFQVSRHPRSGHRPQRDLRKPQSRQGLGSHRWHLRPWARTAHDRRGAGEAYPISRCISCTCCMEACPQFNEDTGFVGAATIAQVRLFNTHPTGKALQRERLSALMGDGGIQECGYAQNCVEVCPKDIPLTNAISKVSGDVMKQAIGDFSAADLPCEPLCLLWLRFCS